jgi:hypothetical protein
MIDWEDLSRRIGCVSKDGLQESVSGHDALHALAILIGEDELRAAVDFYVAGQRPGGELVRAVLHVLEPVAAMERCHEIFQADLPQEERVAAIELLRAIASRHALAWLGELLADPDSDIQALGAEVLESVVGRDARGEELFETYSKILDEHSNERVRAVARRIRQFQASGSE